MIKDIVKWIQSHHPNQSGIIYCLSKKDTHAVCEGMLKESNGRIKCGVYHADLFEVDIEFTQILIMSRVFEFMSSLYHQDDKERIHTLWRKNELHVIVATIAFGLGINHPNCRFIIHHSMSKSVEGYYQESGRAGKLREHNFRYLTTYLTIHTSGRDGLPADCIALYRGQDGEVLWI